MHTEFPQLDQDSPSAPVADRPVRVCFVIDRLRVAGTETQLVSLIQGLDRARVQPHLCLLDGTDSLSRSLEPADCPLLRLGVRALHHPSTLGAAWRFVRFLRQRRIDVVQMHFPDSTYFADLRKLFKINSFVAGVIESSHDATTGQSFAVSDAMKDLTFSDLQLLKTPWGRAYLAIAQK